MASTETLAQEDYFRILVVGDSGTHKTHFIGDLPSPYVFDMDKGLSILRGRKGIEYDSFKDAPYRSKNIMPDQGIYQFGTAWEKLLVKLNDLGEMIDKGTCPYKTICIDSLTTLANICLNYVLVNSKKFNPKDPIDPGQWGMQMRLLETLMDQLTAWPVNLYVTAHIQRDTNTVTQNVEHLPLVTGKLAGKISLYFGDVWFSDIKGEGSQAKFMLHTQKSAMRRQAKSRNGVPTDIEFTWSSLAPYVFPSG